MIRLFAISILAATIGAHAQLAPVVLLNDAKPDDRTLHIDVAVLRFIAKNSGKDSTTAFTKARNIAEVLDAMNKLGAGDEMFRGSRYLSGWPKQSVLFHCLEHRPAFRFGGTQEKVTYSSFGLNLNVSAAPSNNSQNPALTWAGSYSWSTNFIPKDIWETLLMGVMSAGKVVGATFEEKDQSDAVGLRREGSQTVGKDLASFFSRKKKTEKAKEAATPAPVPTPAQQHYLDAIRAERKLFGQLDLAPNQMALLPINQGDRSSIEEFYLAIRYEWE
jgi:hypothetical protein